MRLLYHITMRISVALLILLTVWAMLFYVIIIDEINDETDDSLEDYSEYIITRALAGEKLPEKDNGTNNSYHITPVTQSYADVTPGIRYSDEMVYIYSKKETEPARILKTIYKDSENQYYELTVMIPTIEKEDLQQTILWWIVILYIILLLAILLVNAWVLHRSFKPLYSLLGWLESLTLGEEVPPLNNNTNVTEFQDLNRVMLQSAKRNAEMYKAQSLFIGHASHELQTPVAIAQNRIEVLLDDLNFSEKQLGELVKVKQTLEHIAKLNRTLLLLTKIENRQFPDNVEVNVNMLLKDLLSDFSEAYGYLNISSRYEQKAQLNVFMNSTLASILFSNLLKNAYTHNHENGCVEVFTTAHSITISNTSTSGALNPDYIFRHFYQGNKKEGSMGLGLSLAKSICTLYNMDLLYTFDNGIHRFEVKIKS